MRILEDRWNSRKGPLFSMFSKIGFVCKSEDFNFQANGIAGFDDLNLLPLPTTAMKLCLDSS